MRKVTQQIKSAFEAGESKTVSNTRTDGASIWLFGHEIVRTVDGEIQFTLAGWNTPTTRERLQAVVSVRTCKGQAILITDGGEVEIDSNEWYTTSGLLAK